MESAGCRNAPGCWYAGRLASWAISLPRSQVMDQRDPGKLAHRLDHRGGYRLSAVIGGQVQQQGESSAAFHQGADRAVARADDQIAFPWRTARSAASAGRSVISELLAAAVGSRGGRIESTGLAAPSSTSRWCRSARKLPRVCTYRHSIDGFVAHSVHPVTAMIGA